MLVGSGSIEKMSGTSELDYSLSFTTFHMVLVDPRIVLFFDASLNAYTLHSFMTCCSYTMHIFTMEFANRFLGHVQWNNHPKRAFVPESLPLDLCSNVLLCMIHDHHEIMHLL